MWDSHYMSDYLFHHGILGQKWGTRNGPPYPLKGGDYTQTEKHAIEKARKSKNSIYNKKHYDQVLKSKSTTLTTLSYNKDRTKNTDMFYAAHTSADKHQYNALFNRKVLMPVYDEDGNEIGSSTSYKFAIDNKLLSDIKVASEDSGANAFMQLYSKDRDFYNFVTDPSRMEGHFVKDKYKFKGYREAGETIDRLRDSDYTPTDRDIQIIYRMFNYVLPSDVGGNQRMAKDVARQRAKFF